MAYIDILSNIWWVVRRSLLQIFQPHQPLGAVELVLVTVITFIRTEQLSPILSFSIPTTIVINAVINIVISIVITDKNEKSSGAVQEILEQVLYF